MPTATVDEAAVYDVRTPNVDDGSAARRGLAMTGIVIFQGGHWIALCRENGVVCVSEDGPTAAVDMLEESVREYLETAEEEGAGTGTAVDQTRLQDFLRSHEGPMAAGGRLFIV